jgi:His/Glu/Gln/Arg/opine family amino acid ABC transporter permease subunit
MGELFASYNILGAFGLTILLAVFSAIGSLLIGTVVAIMRVSPIDFLNKVGAFYVNIVRNTPLTLIIVFCNIGFIVNLGMSFTDEHRPEQHHLGDHRACRSTTQPSSVRPCAAASTPCRLARPRPPDRSG